jgi:hypothetical protein
VRLRGVVYDLGTAKLGAVIGDWAQVRGTNDGGATATVGAGFGGCGGENGCGGGDGSGGASNAEGVFGVVGALHGFCLSRFDVAPFTGRL